MSVIYNNIELFYQDHEPHDNGYLYDGAIERFDVLLPLSYSSLLDVGSGPCFLKQWLQQKQINCLYEAVDVREKSLALCGCTTYTEIPLNKNYELVCLFETVGFNIDFDVQKNKTIFIDLMTKAKQISTKYVVCTVYNESKKEEHFVSDKNSLVWFNKEELEQILNNIGYTNYTIFIREDLHKFLYHIICDVS